MNGVTGSGVTGSGVTGSGVIARLTARSLLGRRRALLLLLLPAVLLAFSALARALAGSDEQLVVSLLGGFALGTLVPLLGLIAGTGAIGPEIDDGSIVYLLTKPLNRHSIVVTKFAVAVAVLTALGALPTFLAGLVLTGTTSDLAVAYAVGAGWRASRTARCSCCWRSSPATPSWSGCCTPWSGRR
ncbi:ABC transporter permease [Blastococcus brunescens]|uniref:ABC transporter permease n=1 Tax=Blastococcus brunescens TaxID=1564165 RepID=A0ABZ1B570_9ACTN|nr:ABC transporter permease [Blastococcus sp. BMG 8361]WRL64861.1 ABC transporter permease [Blastococcus sp. BMG 8361]